jgi:hypothetical protein
MSAIASHTPLELSAAAGVAIYHRRLFPLAESTLHFILECISIFAPKEQCSSHLSEPSIIFHVPPVNKIAGQLCERGGQRLQFNRYGESKETEVDKE